MNESTQSTHAPFDPALARYSRQMLLTQIGEQGQRRLRKGRAVLIGCGAIGSVQADILVRAGIGELRICDRDFVEIDNLQRQVLFNEDDVTAHLPKAQAAADKLARINSEVVIDPIVVDINYTNIERLTQGFDLILDGTDNFETRYLINDLAVKTDRPWIYGAVVATTGLCMTIIPHDTPCLRCVFPEAPPADMNPTCDTAGVLAPSVNVVASLQAVEAIKLLSGCVGEINRKLVQIDTWSGRFVYINIQDSPEHSDCPCCVHHQFPYLQGERGSSTTLLCGRNAVQIRPTNSPSVSLDTIAQKLAPVATGAISQNRFLLKVTIDQYELTIFTDGRAIIKGTEDIQKARTLYAKYVGA